MIVSTKYQPRAATHAETYRRNATVQQGRTREATKYRTLAADLDENSRCKVRRGLNFPVPQQNRISSIVFRPLGSSAGMSGCVQQRAVVGLVAAWLAASDLLNQRRGPGCWPKSSCCSASENAAGRAGGSGSPRPASAQCRGSGGSGRCRGEIQQNSLFPPCPGLQEKEF